MSRTKVVRPFEWGLPPKPLRHREILSRLPAGDTDRPPLLFVHGFAHAAWCWDEHWMPAAAERGWPSYAVSLRGHGGSDRPSGPVLLRDYVHDVLQAIITLPRTPVLIGHSLGGLVVQHVLARYPAVAGVLVTPLPPDQSAGTALKLVRHKPTDLLRATVGLPVRLDREHLFSPGLPDDLARSYVARLEDESPLVQWQAILPRRVPPTRAPVLVLGTPDDGLVPPRDVTRTAQRYGTEPVWFPGMGHDLMLEPRWREPFDTLLDWLDATVVAAQP